DSIELVGLSDFANAMPHQLSGGMQMRVSIARALAKDPNIILMDEPFGSLDEITRQELNDELQRIWLKQKRTILFVTHSVSEAVFLSTRIVVMTRRPGKIAHEIEVPFTFPRKSSIRSKPDFAELCGVVSDHLRTSL
ncbi:MAG: ABC transporter ATP-binding protein, partial [Candidatus Lindowbacteria bacterium]|nr:ABC transporter ATP-binding protein [Candidatus Lindowbacteria bacterium]